MNIGDKVRLVHGREEGIIHAFLPGNVVEIEIEDGFRIPVLRKEIVTISPVEAQRMVKTDAKTGEPASPVTFFRQAPFAEKGIYIAFVAVNDRSMLLYLVNNSDFTLPFTAFAEADQRHNALLAGILAPRSQQKVTELNIKDFESWPTFEFNMLYFREGNVPVPAAFQKRIKCRAQTFYKKKAKVPVLDKEGYLYQLDEQTAAIMDAATAGKISTDLKTSMMEGAATPASPLAKPASVIDLHIEKLTKHHASMPSHAMLLTQLNAFEHNLEMAIANGMHEITFIHGAGAGTLKNELHKRLGKHPHVDYFKDALKDKFGYGATLVRLK